MILITLGSQKFQFNRLLKAIDQLVENGEITDDIVAQIGYSDYKPRNYYFKQFMDRNEFSSMVAKSDIVITHGGTGAIIEAVKKGKKVIAVPRLSKYGEHIDDHQLQLVGQFKNLNLICECDDCEELGGVLENIKIREFNNYHSNTQTIIDSIEKFINSVKG